MVISFHVRSFNRTVKSFHTIVRLFDQEKVRKIVKVVGMVHFASLFSVLDLKSVTVFDGSIRNYPFASATECGLLD